MGISRNLVIFAAVIAGGFVISDIMIGARNSTLLRRNTKDVTKSHEIMQDSLRLLLRLVDAESGHRGFIITGEESYLEIYNSSSNQAKQHLAALVQYVDLNNHHRQTVSSIRRLLDQRLKELDGSIQLRQEEGFEAAQQRIGTHLGKQTMEELRASIDEFRKTEEDLLESRGEQLESVMHSSLLTSLVTGMSVVLALCLLLWSGHVLFKNQLSQKLQLQSKTRLLEATLAGIGDGVVTIDCDGYIVDLNEVAERILGIDREALLNQLLDERLKLVDAKTRQPVPSTCAEAFASKTRSPFSKNLVAIREDGTEVPVEDSASVIIDADGNVTGCILILRDVTEQVNYESQLVESENTFRALFELAPIGIVYTDRDGRLVRVNEQFCRILGMTQEELRNKSLAELAQDKSVPGEAEGSVNDTISMFRGESEGLEFEKRYVHPDGRITWVAITARLIRNAFGEPLSSIAAVTDISESRQVEEMRRRMEAIVEASHDAIISKDINGIIQSWNPAAERLLGYRAKEIIGTSIFKLIPESEKTNEINAFNKAARREMPSPFRTKRIRRDGTPVDVMVSVSLLTQADGQPIGYSAIARDLTKELLAAAELSEREQRFKALADNMSQLAWMADKHGEYYWVNQRWLQYTGTSVESMRTSKGKDIIHPDYFHRVVSSFQNSINNLQPWEETFPIRGQHGHYRWFLTRALPIFDEQGAVINWFGSNTDITELIEKEESLKQARLEAENANRSRGEFLANMSHEIRTPMTAILGHTDIMLDHVTNPDDLQSLITIQQNGRYLLQIINDILDLSKIDAGKLVLDRSKVVVADLWSEIHSLLDVRAAEKNISLDFAFEGPIPRVIETDPVRLRQILVNLIGNAIKFTDEGGVTATCHFMPEEGQLSFEISDTGIGIAERELPKLFQPFEQTDTTSTRAYEGTGLGLAISRRLARILGGDITAQSTLRKGSVFTLTISVGDVSDSEQMDELKPSIHSTEANTLHPVDGTVLIVDDRRDILFIAQNLIEKAGGKVITASNGEEAIKKLCGNTSEEEMVDVDIVLMDMQMPVMDGYTAVQKLRILGFTKPIIALTANAMKEDRDRCLQCGCDDYATKPLAGPTLTQIIAAQLDRTRQQ